MHAHACTLYVCMHVGASAHTRLLGQGAVGNDTIPRFGYIYNKQLLLKVLLLGQRPSFFHYPTQFCGITAPTDLGPRGRGDGGCCNSHPFPPLPRRAASAFVHKFARCCRRQKPQAVKCSICAENFAGYSFLHLFDQWHLPSFAMAASKALILPGDDSQSPSRTVALKQSGTSSEASDTRQLLHLFERSLVLRSLSDNIEGKVVSSALSASIRDDLFKDAFAELPDSTVVASLNPNDQSELENANVSPPQPALPASVSRFLQLSFAIVHASDLRSLPVPWRPNSLTARVCNPFAIFQCCGQTFSTGAQHISRNPVWKGSWTLVVPSAAMHDDTLLNVSVYSDDSSRGFSNILVGSAALPVKTIIGAFGSEKQTWVKLSGAESGELSFQCVCTEMRL